MVNIIKEEITLEESLKKKLEFICDFAKVEPHKVIINTIMFLVFNYSNDVYIKNFGNKIKINELENYLKRTN